MLELGVFSGALRAWEPQQIVTGAAAVGLDTLEWEVGAGDRAHISLGSFQADAAHCAEVSERAGLSICGVCGDFGMSMLSRQDVSSLIEACIATGVTQARMFAPAPGARRVHRHATRHAREALGGYDPSCRPVAQRC